MKTLVFVVVLILFAAPSMGKVFNRCSLAKELKRLGVAAADIPIYVCIAKYESNYNTAALGRPNYGIFQINSSYWCSPPKGSFYSPNNCKVNCSKLLTDNISDDVKCAQLIKKLQGWEAWSVYRRCKNPGSVKTCY